MIDLLLNVGQVSHQLINHIPDCLYLSLVNFFLFLLDLFLYFLNVVVDLFLFSAVKVDVLSNSLDLYFK